VSGWAGTCHPSLPHIPSGFNPGPGRFWLRSVAAHPDEIYDDREWHFWQYTGTGRVPGITGDTDINVFVGNTKQWNEWLKATTR